MPKFCAICDNQDRQQCAGAKNYNPLARRPGPCLCTTCHDSRLIEVTVQIEVFEAPEEREVLTDQALKSALESKVRAAMAHTRDRDRDFDFDFEVIDIARTTELDAGEHVPTLEHVLEYLEGNYNPHGWHRNVASGNKEALEVARKAAGAQGRLVMGNTVHRSFF